MVLLCLIFRDVTYRGDGFSSTIKIWTLFFLSWKCGCLDECNVLF